MEARLRTSSEQFMILLEFMERHSDISQPQPGIQGRLRADRLWQELTDTLNSVGSGVQRSTEKWKRVWADWKTKSKRKASKIRVEASSTGGGPSSRQMLTALEERVLKFVTLSAVFGQRDVEEQGFDLQLFQTATAEALPPSAASGSVHTVQPDTDSSLYLPNAVDDSQPGPSQIVQEVERQVTPPPQPPLVPQSQSTPRRRAQRLRRRHNITPFERATNEFVAIEEQRLQLEENRDRRLHEREVERERMINEREVERERMINEREVERERMINERELEHLRVETERLEIERVRNEILQRLAVDIPQIVRELLLVLRSSINNP